MKKVFLTIILVFSIFIVSAQNYKVDTIIVKVPNPDSIKSKIERIYIDTNKFFKESEGASKEIKNVYDKVVENKDSIKPALDTLITNFAKWVLK